MPSSKSSISPSSKPRTAKDDQLTELIGKHLSALQAKEASLTELKRQHLSDLKDKDDSHANAIKGKDQEITELKRLHLDAMNAVQVGHLEDLAAQAEHYSNLREGRAMQHLAELAARDHQSQVANAMHLLAIENLAQSHASKIKRLM